jgi:hypothetical protein
VLTVIFGAGASFDSSTLQPVYAPALAPVSSQRPLLTNDLFKPGAAQTQGMQRWPEIIGLVERVRPACEPHRIGFEQALAELVAAGSSQDGKRQRAMQLLALRYYLREVITAIDGAWTFTQGGSSAYVGLLEEVEEWRQRHSAHVELISFNYDTLLERGIERALLHLDVSGISEQHGPEQPYRLYKTHGSIDRLRPTPVTWDDLADPPLYGSPHKKVMRLIDHLALDEPTDSIIKRPAMDNRLLGVVDGFIYVPAIAVPVAGKVNWEMSQNSLTLMETALAETDDVLVIGWAAQDSPFRQLLTAARRARGRDHPIGRLMVVDIPSQAARVAGVMAGPCGFNPSVGTADPGISLAEQGFAGALANGRIREWLSF